MNNTKKIAIIGTGPAGLACATALETFGIERDRLVLFDKSRGTGGRVASRRRPGFEWHHGAGSVHLDDPTETACSTATYRRALKAVASQYTVHLGTELHRIESQDTATPKRPATEGKPAPSTGTQKTLQFTNGTTAVADTVLMCLPAPQIEAILSRSKLQPLAELDQVHFDPCWSLMLGLARPVRDLPELPRPFERSTISSDGRSVVLHTDALWAQTHMEAPAASVKLRLLGHAPRAWKDQGVLRCMVHRWRYAQPAVTLGQSCVWDEGRDIGAAGDWAFGATVGDAIASGVALAQAVGH